MPRNKDAARRRLMKAALELFAEQEFERTTAAEIAARAGVTGRTFFRHFPDKREVLFDGQAILSGALSEAIAQARPGLTPLETLRRAFDAVTDMLERNRPYSEPRQRIIAATPALQEREVAKHAALTRIVGQALEKRGVETRRAHLAAETGLAVLRFALEGWFADPSTPLAHYMDRGFAEAQGLWSPDRNEAANGKARTDGVPSEEGEAP